MKPAFDWVFAPKTTQTRPAPSTTSSGGVSDRIEQAFAAASDTTGTSFDYLVKTAQRESALDASAKARTSSAAGLFQFIESTWLETMKSAGTELGLDRYAAAIEKGSDGKYRVADPAVRKQILDLRYDPEIASMMAGALTRRNAGYLADRLGRDVSAGELYIAHFLGARGAASLIDLVSSSPETTAAEVFPRQAGANRSIFYDGKTPRTVAEVYGELVSQHGGGAPVMTAALQRAATAPVETASLDAVMTGLVASASLTEAAPSDAPASDAPTLAATGLAAAPPPAAVADGAAEVAASRITGAEAVLGYADDAGERVRSGWAAGEVETAFEGLFRTDQPAVASGAVQAFFRGFTLTPGLFDVAAAADTEALAEKAEPTALSPPVASPFEEALRKRRGPLDLTRYLNIKS